MRVLLKELGLLPQAVYQLIASVHVSPPLAVQVLFIAMTADSALGASQTNSIVYSRRNYMKRTDHIQYRIPQTNFKHHTRILIELERWIKRK